MSDAAKVDLQAKYFEQGHRMAREAESGSFEAVNKELATIRGQIKPAEYNALINSIRSANTAHVAEDQSKNRKDPSKLSVPTLLLEDSPTDSDKLPDHIAGRILADGHVQSEGASAERKNPSQITDSRTAIDDKMRQTGNYPMPWSEASADAAWRHVLQPSEKVQRKGN